MDLKKMSTQDLCQLAALLAMLESYCEDNGKKLPEGVSCQMVIDELNSRQ